MSGVLLIGWWLAIILLVVPLTGLVVLTACAICSLFSISLVWPMVVAALGFTLVCVRHVD